MKTNGIDESWLLVKNQVSVVGRTIFGFISMEFSYIPILKKNMRTELKSIKSSSPSNSRVSPTYHCSNPVNIRSHLGLLRDVRIHWSDISSDGRGRSSEAKWVDFVTRSTEAVTRETVLEKLTIERNQWLSIHSRQCSCPITSELHLQWASYR